MTVSALPADAAVGVIGAGTMGAGIARVAAEAGHVVFLYDTASGAVDAARAEMRERLERAAEKGRMTAADVALILDRVVPSADLADLAEVGLVIEAIVEDLAVKRDLLALLETIVGPDTIFATNTSSLSVTAIGRGLQNPSRLAGMHFFNPAPVLPLVEIVSGRATAPEVAATCFATAEAWGKTPVHCASTPGFIVNRVARPFYGEALRLLAEGAADAATIDHVVEGAGRFRMGPFTLMDLVGLDVNLAVSKSVYEQTFHDPRFSPSPVQQSLVDAGHLGRKSAQGFYGYGSGAVNPEPEKYPECAGPGVVIVNGDLGWAGTLLDRLDESPVAVEYGPGPDPGYVRMGDVVLLPTDGRTATGLVAANVFDTKEVAVLDLLRPGATRVAFAVADQAADGTSDLVAGLLQSAGIEPVVVDDTPALILMRIVAQLASVAADAVLVGVAAPHAIDTAMKLGTNYPLGPIEWVDDLRPPLVIDVLSNIADHYGEERYRASALLRRAASTGRNLLAEGGPS
jgi:3-hydroxybutyryl-CoA dehydrogenase